MNIIKMAILLLGVWLSALAQATPVTWEMGGKITDLFAVDPVAVGLGDQINVFIHFDTDAPLLNQNTPGRYVYSPASVWMDLWINGAYTETFHPELAGSLLVRNDSLFQGNQVDGVTFAVSLPDDNGSILTLQTILRGTDTGVLNSGDLLAAPPAGLLSEGTHNFQVCRASSSAQPGDCDLLFVDVTLDTLQAVPEPDSLALLATGLGLLGVARRRRALA